MGALSEMQKESEGHSIGFVGKEMARNYDFSLNVPLMDEFVDAANAYGRRWHWYLIYVSVFFIAILCMGIGNGRIAQQKKFFLICFVVLTLLAAVSAFSHRLLHIVIMQGMLYTMQSWFSAFGSKGRKGRQQFRKVMWGLNTDSLVSDPGWRTPCRVSVSEDRLRMVRWVSGKVYEDGCPWRYVECVRVTPHAIVLGPSAWSKAHTTHLDGGSVRTGDVNNCVVIPKNALTT